jgi:hypothetical protein
MKNGDFAAPESFVGWCCCMGILRSHSNKPSHSRNKMTPLALIEHLECTAPKLRDKAYFVSRKRFVKLAPQKALHSRQ